ncbi:MAG: ceramidase domain-containing protein [Proteobacteria bacterium]|nr:ceramidase domain-containing protein [Pseudomonadota bacterium]
MDFMSQVDHYCERSDFSFFAEPLNLFSNLFFWLGAYLIYRRARSIGLQNQAAIMIPVLLMVLVGFCSGLFHSLASRWAEILDVGAIGMFVLAFLWYWLRQILLFDILRSFGIFLGFFVCTGLLYFLSRNLPLNGSQGYFGLIIFLFALGLHQRRRLAGSLSLLQAGLVFLVALVFRTLDASVCEVFPWGTHMFWHLGNAIVSFLAMKAMLEEQLRVALARHP